MQPGPHAVNRLHSFTYFNSVGSEIRHTAHRLAL